jgi:hypothetical protein
MRDETQHAVSVVDPRAETSRQGGQLSAQLLEGNAKRSDARVWIMITTEKLEKNCASNNNTKGNAGSKGLGKVGKRIMSCKNTLQAR